MEIRFLDVAQQEFDEAVEYYNAESLGPWGSVVAGSAGARKMNNHTAAYDYGKCQVCGDQMLARRPFGLYSSLFASFL